MPLPHGEAVELHHDLDLGGQQQRLDLAAQASQAERHDGRPQLGRAGDVAVALVEGDAHLQPLLTHWVSSRIVPRTEAVHRMPVGLWGRM